MSNHLHFVIRTEAGCLSKFMHRLETSYASRFNRSRKRQGHVLQGRFNSRVVHDEADLANVTRYVHRNPLEAGLVPDARGLTRYAWSGHAALVGRREPYAFEAVEETLALFGANREEATRAYRAWVARGAEETREEAAPGAPDAFTSLVRAMCSQLGVSETELLAGRRRARVSDARTRICQQAVGDLGLRARDVALRLGMSESAVSQALRRVT
jgi:hypothetical protein